jgi:ribonucleoside-diphosphate reductase alpha chain
MSTTMDPPETGPHRIGLRRLFTSQGVDPYDEVLWERRDARITNWADGTVAFEQTDVEFPTGWSQNATNIVAQKYFRGTVGRPERESSLRQVIDRVVDTITRWGIEGGYFADDAEASAFSDELKYILVTQRAAFNSPVWFNIGVDGVPQQASACYILEVDDTMDSILEWYRQEGLIFKGGSGAGTNLSRIRSSAEHLRGGGTASGPVSFMRGADASAGTIKCLESQTPVLTDRGFTPISNVAAGDRVATRFGMSEVLAVHDNGIRDLVRLRTGLGDSVRCTPEHRFWIRHVRGEGWCEVGALPADSYVRIDLSAQRHGEVQPLVHVWRGYHTEKQIELPPNLGEAMALWLGWLWGDGSITSRKSAKFVSVQIGDDDPELVDRYIALTKSLFGSGAHLYVNRTRDRSDRSVAVRIASSALLRFLARNGLTKGKAAELRVPALIFSSPPAVRAAFLAGLFEADGHVGNGYAWLSTVSERLAADVHRLLLSIGIPSHIGAITDRRSAMGDRPVSTVRIVGQEGMHRFAKQVGFISNRKDAKLVDACRRKGGSPFETQWHLPHVTAELSAVWSATSDQLLRRALSPYCRTQNPRRMSLLRARALVDRFPRQLMATSLGRFALGDEFYSPVSVEDGGEGATFDLTVADVHEYVVQGLVTHNSGGKTRRAAKMVILNADHPDIEEFVWCKAIEERKTRVLRDAGFDMDLDGKDSFSVQYQNANNSVRVTDEFMQAVIADADWDLLAVKTGDVLRTVKARDLWRQIALAAWECADPGLQFDTTINRWHTLTNSGPIEASNPCSEFLSINNSACNLASINLLPYLDDDRFDVDAFKHTVELVFTAQEILVGRADYPTEKLTQNSHDFRQLGLGYTNIGAMLMALGLPYDSVAGRAWAAAITSLTTGHAYATSARTAARVGPFAGFAENEEHMLRVLRMHRDAAHHIEGVDAVPPYVVRATHEAWESAVRDGEEYGVRNSQATVLAPTGTISFMLDADTTGIEPDLSLVKTKKLVGGGTMSIVNQTVPRALAHLGYDESQVAEIIAYIDHEKSVIGAPHLSAEHLPVFACSMGDNPIHYEGHVRMLAAVQPFISGAVSKTTNMPESATVEDVEHMHQLAWELGLKSIAIYRDNCKVGQPLSTTKKASASAPTPSQVTLFDGEAVSGATQVVERIVEKVVHRPVRQKLPRNRRGRTLEFRVADCKGFLTVGEYDDGRPGEVFLTVSKQGSTLAGIMDAFAKSISYGLQYGVPLRAFVEAFTNMRFEPAGMTDDPEIRFASSVMDYLFRKLAMEYLSYEERAELSIFSVSERMQPTLPGMEEAIVETRSGTEMVTDPKSVPGADELADQMHAGAIAQTPVDNTPAAGVIRDSDAPMCMQCGVTMVRAGSCHACPSCGSTSGCS